MNGEEFKPLMMPDDQARAQLAQSDRRTIDPDRTVYGGDASTAADARDSGNGERLTDSVLTGGTSRLGRHNGFGKSLAGGGHRRRLGDRNVGQPVPMSLPRRPGIPHSEPPRSIGK